MDTDTYPKRIYISGAITGTSDYLQRFQDAEELFKDNFEVINPTKIEGAMPSDASHKEYMSVCFPLLDMAEYIYMLKGWEKSTGACQEYGYAKGKGIKVIFEQ